MKGFPSFYNNLDVYGFTGYDRSGRHTAVWRGHGGQCRSYACWILFRSGTFQQRLPSYGACPWGYRSYRQIRVGDVIETTWPNGHTAIVVGILGGVEGSSVTGVNVIDSNYAGDEVIAMHPIYVTSRGGVGDLRSYRALNLPLQ